jgi:hypothetical protein
LEDTDEILPAVIEQPQVHADLLSAMVQNLDTREAQLMRFQYGLCNNNEMIQLKIIIKLVQVPYKNALML